VRQRSNQDNPHALIAVMYDELLRSMNSFFANLEKNSADLELRGKSMSRSLTIIYALQSSLNFEAGGEIAENLFRLYEYARQQLLASAKSEESEGHQGCDRLTWLKFVMPGG
jgi:flagellar protein FliS